MDNQIYNQIVNFIWSIADDCLRDVYVRGKYRDVILPMVVIRRLDAVLEETKENVLKTKIMLDSAGIQNQTEALCKTAGQSFCNSSPFMLKDLTSRAQQQKLKSDFIAYLDGFSPNVQEILEKFKFRNQIDTMIEADILGAVIEKFVSPTINLSPYPVMGDMDEVKLQALDNHTMGVIFEELIRKFNEENNEEAGEHFTPRDVVELMVDCIFMPVADKISDTTYTVYDGASGTGGMLTVAHDRLQLLSVEHKKKVSIHLFGQEINPETYAITKADMLLKGEGEEAEHIAFGSTLSNDGFPTNQFDFMLSNPPYGKAWKTDAEKLGGKKDISDTRFVTSFKNEADFAMIPRVSDGQMLFMLNNIAKMKTNTILGSRIAEVHNGSSLFTGDAGQGESNARRYIIENDLLECIIALPEKMFYNTGIGTFIWILSNKKEVRRKGKVQLIDATSLKSPLRKNLGQKNCELTPEFRKQILDLYMNFEENEYSKVFDNHEFGYWKVTVLQPELNADGKPVCDKKGKLKADKEKTDTEQIPFTYENGITGFMEKEVLPFAPDAWIDEKKTQIGYEVSFTKYFYKPVPPQAEQDQIVRYLDWQTKKITKLINAKKKQIELLKEKKQAVINKAVTKGLDDTMPMKDSGIKWLGEMPEHWEVNRLKNGCHMINRGITPQYTEDTSNAMVVNQATFSKGYWDISKIRYTLTKPEKNRALLCNNDVLIASTGGGVLGKVYHYRENGIFIADSHVTIIRCNEKLISKFVYYSFLIKYDLINALLAQGSTNQTELQRDWVVAFSFPFPSIEEQQVIVTYLEEKTALIDKAISVIEKEIELVSEYKTSLISNVVTGKVDVRDVPVPEFEEVGGMVKDTDNEEGMEEE